MPADKAALMGRLLTTNDLRGVFSHGTRQTAAYVSHFRKGELTPDPDVRLVKETPTALIFDGGGGLGYFPCYEAATRLCAKAKEQGIAVSVTRNHGHFGAAGIYSRVILQADLFGYVTSGHQLNLQPGHTILTAAGGSPMSYGIPTGSEPPFALDFGAVHDMYPGSQHVDELIRLAPGTVFRCIGMGSVCQSLGGFLCGVPVDPARAERVWSGANQGSFMIAVDPGVFIPLDQFKAEMDEYSRKVRELAPLAGFDQAVLAGTMEWQREQRYTEEGIPISPLHADLLRRLGEDFGIKPPV
jgi:LDH2 family malate/lactate/ureidoglycolate dehydrogenase